jgi:mercuric ion transport protein
MLEALRQQHTTGELSEAHENRADRGGYAALALGGIAALLVGACCVGPLVLVTIGLGGAWLASLTSLEPYSHIFAIVALVSLAFAGRRIYRPSAECKAGGICAVPIVRRGYKIGFWSVVVLLVVMFGFPYVAPLFFWGLQYMKLLKLFTACCTAAALTTPVYAEIKTVTLAVSGMTWTGCVISVKRSLMKVGGVTKADINLEKAEAVVTFDDAKTTLQTLTKATANAGYPSKLKN